MIDYVLLFIFSCVFWFFVKRKNEKKEVGRYAISIEYSLMSALYSVLFGSIFVAVFNSQMLQFYKMFSNKVMAQIAVYFCVMIVVCFAIIISAFSLKRKYIISNAPDIILFSTAGYIFFAIIFNFLSFFLFMYPDPIRLFLSIPLFFVISKISIKNDVIKTSELTGSDPINH